MSDNEPITVKLENVIYAVLVALGIGVFACGHLYLRGQRYGACVEMCRPAKFDVDQQVNGGCLCIGSDKVLRLREAP